MKTYRYAAYRHIAQQGVRKTRKLAIYARKINLREYIEFLGGARKLIAQNLISGENN